MLAVSGWLIAILFQFADFEFLNNFNPNFRTLKIINSKKPYAIIELIRNPLTDSEELLCLVITSLTTSV
jgi:hypothetical protein